MTTDRICEARIMHKFEWSWVHTEYILDNGFLCLKLMRSLSLYRHGDVLGKPIIRKMGVGR
jgi:hypothetical protein